MCGQQDKFGMVPGVSITGYMDVVTLIFCRDAERSSTNSVLVTVCTALENALLVSSGGSSLVHWFTGSLVHWFTGGDSFFLFFYPSVPALLLPTLPTLFFPTTISSAPCWVVTTPLWKWPTTPRKNPWVDQSRRWSPPVPADKPRRT